MNSTTDNQQNNVIRNIVLAVIALIVIITLAVVGFNTGRKDRENQDNDDQNSSQVQNDSNAAGDTSQVTQNDQTKGALSDYAGVYQGRGSLFAGAFQFPNTTFTAKENSQFELNAKGLDLIITQNPALSINNVYPVLNVTANGDMAVESDGSILMMANDLTYEFTVAGQPLDPATSQSLMSTLEGLLNFKLPEVTAADPLKINTVFVKTDAGKLDISNQTGTDNQIYVSFSGAEVK